MYPEPSDVTEILTWLVSSISYLFEQVCIDVFCNTQEKKKLSETKATEGSAIIQALTHWRENGSQSQGARLSASSSDSSHVVYDMSSMLDEESELLCKEHLRFLWNRIPSVLFSLFSNT